MSKKKFNSKIVVAAGEYEGLSTEELKSMGMQVHEPKPRETSSSEEAGGRPQFSQLRTVSREPLQRDPIINYRPDRNLSAEERVEVSRVDPEEFEAKKRKILENKNPESIARTSRQRQNRSDMHLKRAVLSLIDRTAREAYPCTDCNGAKNGGKPIVPTESDQTPEFCSCGNTGTSLKNPLRDVFNLKKYAKNHNKAAAYHEKYCTERACGTRCVLNAHPLCGHTDSQCNSSCKHYAEPCGHIEENPEDNCKSCKNRGMIDRFRARAINSGGEEKLDEKQTHSRPGSNPDVASVTAPISVVDGFKPIATAWDMLGGREDSPIQKFTPITFTNHDTSNPDADTREGEHQPNFETYYTSTADQYTGVPRTPKNEHGISRIMPSHNTPENWFKSIFKQKLIRDDSSSVRGYKDKQMCGVVTHVNRRGTKCHILVRGNNQENIRSERGTRTLGRPDRNIALDAGEGINQSFDRDSSAEDNLKRSKFQQHVSNLFDHLRPMHGELSPEDRGNWIYLRNVPIDKVARISDVTAPLLATSGHVMQNIDKSKVIDGYKGSSKIKAKTIYRRSLGISAQEFREGAITTPSNYARKAMKYLGKDAHKALDKLGIDIKPGHPEILLPDVLGADSIPSVKKPTDRELKPVEPSGKQFSQTELPKFKIDMPIPDMPDEVDSMSSEESQKDLHDTLRKHLRRNLSEKEMNTAIEGFTEQGGIRGALKNLGESSGVDEDEDY